MNIQTLVEQYQKRADELDAALQDEYKKDVASLSKGYNMSTFVEATIIQLNKTIEDLKKLAI